MCIHISGAAKSNPLWFLSIIQLALEFYNESLTLPLISYVTSNFCPSMSEFNKVIKFSTQQPHDLAC